MNTPPKYSRVLHRLPPRGAMIKTVQISYATGNERINNNGEIEICVRSPITGEVKWIAAYDVIRWHEVEATE